MLSQYKKNISHYHYTITIKSMENCESKISHSQQLHLPQTQSTKDMKFLLFISFAIVYLYTQILASPRKGGIGDGYIYPAKQTASKPKTTSTYYARPLHPPIKKPSGPPKPRPEVFKVIIQDQIAQIEQPRKQEQIFKIIHLPKNGGHSGGGKSVKILKIFHVKQSKVGHKGGWSK